VALPDPNDKATYPLQGYPAGTEVMGLYPETTSFYHGNIVATLSMQKNKAMYKVMFDDVSSALPSPV
jgi:hypothetical protein